VDRLPAWVQGILSLLPITHAATVIRAAALGEKVPALACLVLLGMGLALFLAAARLVKRARE
jgi:ABC-type polysaccharide/polyol phosphate export permease